MRALRALRRDDRKRARCDRMRSTRPIGEGLDRDGLQSALPPGAARNALDCALWDLAAKRAGKRAWEIAGILRPRPVITAYTISLDTPEAMAKAARAREIPAAQAEARRALRSGAAEAPCARRVPERAADRRCQRRLARGRPGREFRGLRRGRRRIDRAAAACGRRRRARGDRTHPVPVCADESAHDRDELAATPRKIRSREHQARQDRRPDRGARARRRRPTAKDSSRS